MVYYSNNLTLFSSEIDPRRNLFIDDIEQYLASLSSTVTLEDFKRFTPSEAVSVRVSVTDAQMAFGAYLTSRWNYARVLYEDDSLKNSYYWYYFVTSIEMVADGTLAISLQLDALNTFRNWKGALTDRTFVTRQLVNRWDESGKPDNVFTPEDVSGKIIKASERKVTAEPGYLIFDGIEGTPSLELTSDEGIPVANRFRTESIWALAKYTDSGNGCFLLSQGAKTITINYRLAASSTWNSETVTTAYPVYVGFVKRSSGLIYKFVISQSGAVLWSRSDSEISNAINFAASGTFEVSSCTASVTGADDAPTFSDAAKCRSRRFSDIDRTLSSICKIVAIPFLPDSGAEGCFVFNAEKGDSYEYVTRYVMDSIESQPVHIMPISLANIVRKKPTILSKANALLEDPKIYSGSFAYYKVVYDSYSTTIAMDNLDPSATDFRLKWVGSAAISSSSIIMFEQYYTTPSGTEVTLSPQNAEEDYPILLTSDRNNELPLYSSAWLDYLRNGYNYDKKTNAMSIANSVLSTVGSLVTAVAAAATPGGQAFLPAAIGMASSAVAGWTSTASTINSQIAKETQLKSQSASVASVNDLSLFKAYGNATVKIEWWEPREDYKMQLGALFFYRGYSVNRQYEPSLDVRTSFDYIECVPSWSGSFIQRTPPQFISLLNDRLAQGVTIIHHYDDAWDIAQEKGNLEK